MEEIKEIVTLIGTLPDIAIYIATGFLAYKTIIVGSIYGVIKHIANIWYKTQINTIDTKILILKELNIKIIGNEEETIKDLKEILQLCCDKADIGFLLQSDLQTVLRKLREL